MANRSRCIATLAIFLICYATSSTSVAGQSRIAGGKKAAANSAPFIVSLQKSEKGKNIHYCGGTILNANWVVTAAHCLSSKTLAYSTVLVAGSILVDGSTSTVQKRNIDYYVVHELFVGGIAPYDIGLVYTKLAFKWTSAVGPAVLPKADSTPSGTASLYGWGSTSTTAADKFPSSLQVVSSIPIITLSECENELGSHGSNLHDTNVCTGDSNSGISICKSDSGGPLIQGKTLVGIISWGKTPCGQKNSPSVYVRVSAFNSWIIKHQIAPKKMLMHF
ncbi:lectizyme-like [Episyrphus balteatus]|uniref:lectizyme-like n=1 Tax=Episyrphus balteatus TaxID=286459 RepID=UPI002485D798|nr:lectizyme-like [Episyrphus balteatus]